MPKVNPGVFQFIQSILYIQTYIHTYFNCVLIVYIYIYTLTYQSMRRLEPPLSGHYRPESARNGEYARLSEITMPLYLQSSLCPV